MAVSVGYDDGKIQNMALWELTGGKAEIKKNGFFSGLTFQTKNSSTLNLDLSVNKNNGSIGTGFSTLLSSKELDVSKLNNINDVGSFRRSENYEEVLQIIGNAIPINTESGGKNAYNKDWRFDANAIVNGNTNNFGGNIGASITYSNGDVFNVEKIKMGAGINSFINNGLKGAAEISYTNHYGKNSDNGWGFALGARSGLIGTPELIADISFVRNGTRYTLPVGSVISNISYGNFVGAGLNLVNVFSGEKIPIPRYEVVEPDDKPDLYPDAKIFKKGTNELTKEGLQQLKDIASIVHANSNVKLELGEYYDDKNLFQKILKTTDKEKELSNLRANTIKESLIKMGLSSDNIQIGHQKISENDNKMTINDNNTNIHLISDNKLITHNGASFNALRSSPLGEKYMENLLNSLEFKEFSKNKSDLEKEIASNVLFDKLIISKSISSIDEGIKKLNENIYDKGLSFEKTLFKMNDKEVIEKIKENPEFKNYVNGKNIESNESNRLALMALKMNDTNGFSLKESINYYEQSYLKKGFNLTEFDKKVKEFNKIIENNPIYQEATKNSKDEKNLLSSYVVHRYLKQTNHNDFKLYSDAMLKNIKEYMYDKGNSFARDDYLKNGRNNDYIANVHKEIKEAMKKNENIQNTFNSYEFKKIAVSSGVSTIEEKKNFENYIKQVRIQNPKEDINNIIDVVINNSYKNGKTISQLTSNNLDLNDKVNENKIEKQNELNIVNIQKINDITNNKEPELISQNIYKLK